MKLDLNTGVNIQIGGEAGRYNTLPLEVLIRLSENLQRLVKNIAKYDLDTDYEIDYNNFNVELAGFNKGSAIPAFVLTPRVKYVISENNVTKQREFVNKRFNRLMQIADGGDYSLLKQEYPSKMQRNVVATSLSDFTNSAGNSPMAFTRINKGGKVDILSNVQRIKPNVLKSLISKIEKEEETSEEFGVGRIRYSTTKSGRRSKKIVEEIRDDDAALSYTTNEIQFFGKTYILNSMLNCKLEKEDNYVVIENSILDIVGTGENIEFAKSSFAEEFDYIFKRYNELEDKELTTRVRIARDFINLIVKEII